MRKKIPAFIMTICMLLSEGFASASDPGDLASQETMFLKLPDSYANWKAITRYLTDETGAAEYIPPDQHVSNWSELICFQYFGMSFMKGGKSIFNMLERIREETQKAYPGDKVTWSIIEKNKFDAIYEWSVRKPFITIPYEQEISRIILTDKGLHRVAFTRKNREVSTAEKEQSIKLLKESVSLISVEKARGSAQGLSIPGRLEHALNLGEGFSDWKVIDTHAVMQGVTVVIHVPPSFTGGYVAECLEVTNFPALQGGSVDKAFEAEMETVKNTRPGAKFRLLKRTEKEAVYSLVYPQDNLQVTAIVRSFLSGLGYWSISYKRGLPRELTPEEVEQWKEKLEVISIR